MIAQEMQCKLGHSPHSTLVNISSNEDSRTYSSEQQVRGNLSDDIGGTPDRVGIVEFLSVKRKILFHATVYRKSQQSRASNLPAWNILKALLMLTWSR